MTKQESDQTLKLVSMAYGVAIQPDRFEDLLTAWDDWFDANVLDAEGAFNPLAPSFDDALSASESLENKLPQRSPMELSATPAILLSQTRDVLDANDAANALLTAEGCDAATLIATAQKSDLSFGNEKLGAYRLGGGQHSRTYLAVEAPVSAAMIKQYPQAAKLLLLSIMDWNDAFAADLATRLSLSEAELRVAKGLLEGLTAQEISGDLDRSVATIRSHIKALLQKSGARRQTELVQLLTILRQTTEAAPPGAKAQNIATDYKVHIVNGPGGLLSVVEYGAGRPVLYFTTSSRPEEVARVRSAFASAGLRIVAPSRPGFRGDARKADCASDALLDDWLDVLIEQAGPAPVFAGHREGGILATKAAARAAKMGHEIGGLALISTGAPVAAVGQFKNAPPTVRRSFLGAHYARAAVILGYRTAARIFHAGVKGEDKIVQYFYRDSPADAPKLAIPFYYETTRDNIAYCFIDPAQIVKDIADWADDWSEAFEIVQSVAPVTFIHGEEHTFHPIKDIETLCRKRNETILVTIPESGQLALYENPEIVAQSLAGLS